MFYNELLFFNTSSTHIRFASNYALQKISNLLQEKGMNSEVALQRAQEVFGKESAKASLYLYNIQRSFDLEVMQKVYAYIAKEALFQSVISFASYDHVLRMMQEAHRVSLSEEEIKKIRNISQANAYAISL
ncbi:hypothetical protein JHD50_09920 [Sulfurimonas sp. MAG313]|nr:hypothetical protein [Sulfurimonas sp. MAG313]MDF1881616.1 hypothetical protein [Sulfurimonas sp. MAG313]